MFSKKLNILLSLSITAILSALMLYYTESIPASGEWYSYDQSLRLQSEAFLRGELAIQPVPHGHRHDWNWGNGMHQAWGLGVPAIQLPFNVIGKLFGSFGFPDRLIFLVFYASVAAILWTCLNSVSASGEPAKESLGKSMENIPILFFALLNPGFITMLHAKFGPYEEVIAYAYLWSFMSFALLYRFQSSRRSYLYFLICLLAGFSVTLRPTAGAYGAVTFLIAFYLAGRSQIRFQWIGLPVYLTGNLVFAMTNYLRFGSPFEFGPNLTLTGSAFSDYVVKFDNPVNWFPFISSAIELISALFFIDFHRLYGLGQGILWQSNPMRVLELNFKPFDAVTLILLFLAWAIVIVVWTRKKRGYPLSDLESRQIIIVGGVWSFISFLMLFLFYSRWPGLLSRYLVDFGPAIVVGIVMLYRYLNDLIRTKFSQKPSFSLNIGLCIVFLSWVFINLSQAVIIPLYGHLSKVELTNVTDSEVARKQLDQMRHTDGPAVPDRYRCGDQEYKYEIPYNNAGWDISNSCRVFLVTTHFLDSPTCLSIHIETIDEAPAWLKKIYPDDEIVVKMGLERLHRSSEVKQGRGKIIAFCSDKKSDDRKAGGQQFKLISIAWGDLRKHPGAFTPPFRLLSLEKVR